MTDRTSQTPTEPAEPTAAPPSRVLVVDDERSMRELLSIVLRRDGYDVLVAEDGAAAVEVLKRERVDILITDIRMPDMNGVDVLREAQADRRPSIVSIVMTAFASTETAVEALRLGAADYVHKSPQRRASCACRVGKELERRRLQQENVLLKRALQTSHQFSNIIGSSAPMLARVPARRDDRADEQHRAHHRRDRAPARSWSRARSTSTRRARTGRSSRSTAARCPRRCSTRSCSATCAARSPAPTRNKKGLIEVAEKGTIFLDEIGEMSPVVQVKLLRVLQERKFRRLGGTEEIDADIRILAATNRDLSKMVAEGQFREDLFYRINVIPLRLPPLRERPDDIPLLAEHFVAKFAAQMGKPITGISGAALALLTGIRLAGQHPRARERDGAGRRARADADDPARQPARAAARGAPRRPPGRRRRGRRRSPTPASTSSATCRTSSASTSPRRCAAPAASRSRPPSCSA